MKKRQRELEETARCSEQETPHHTAGDGTYEPRKQEQDADDAAASER